MFQLIGNMIGGIISRGQEECDPVLTPEVELLAENDDCLYAEDEARLIAE